MFSQQLDRICQVSAFLFKHDITLATLIIYVGGYFGNIGRNSPVIEVQQDNAGPHVKEDNDDVTAAGVAEGFTIKTLPAPSVARRERLGPNAIHSGRSD